MTKRRKCCRPACLGVGGLVVFAVLSSAPRLDATEIAPHGATYNLVLRKTGLPERVTGSSGKLLIRVERICEGWRIGTRLDFQAKLANGETFHVEIVNGIEESTEGDLLSFSTLTRLNGEVQSATKGAAETGPEEGGRAIFTSPTRSEAPLRKGTLFPAAAARELLEKLVAGRTQVQRLIFDGSAPGPYEVLDTVARGRLAPGGAPTGDGALLNTPSWRLQSLWTRDDGREKIQALEVQLHSNGVTSRMIIDLGAMTLDARLVEIQRLPQPDCR